MILKLATLALTLVASAASVAGAQEDADLRGLATDQRPEYYIRSSPSLAQSEKLAHIAEIERRTDLVFTGAQKYVSENGEVQHWMGVLWRQNPAWLHNKGAQVALRKLATLDQKPEALTKKDAASVAALTAPAKGAIAGPRSPGPARVSLRSTSGSRAQAVAQIPSINARPVSAGFSDSPAFFDGGGGGSVPASMPATPGSYSVGAPTGGSVASAGPMPASAGGGEAGNEEPTLGAAPTGKQDPTKQNPTQANPGKKKSGRECAKSNQQYLKSQRLKDAFANAADPFSQWPGPEGSELNRDRNGQWTITWQKMTMHKVPLQLCIDKVAAQGESSLPYFLIYNKRFELNNALGTSDAQTVAKTPAPADAQNAATAQASR